MADRYWVGGTANWDGTAGTKWSATSGGAGGASVPTSADDVFFNAASGAATVTVTTGNARTINCTGFTGALAGSGTLTVYGSVTLSPGMTYTHTGTMTISGSGTIISAGKELCNITVSGAGISVTMGDALTTAASLNLDIVQGSFSTANYALSVNNFFANGSNARSISFGSSTVTVRSSAFQILSGTNLTFDAGTSLLNLSVGSLTAPNGTIFYDVSFNGGNSGSSIAGGLVFNNLTKAGRTSSGVSAFTINADQTINGTLTLSAGTNATMRTFLRSDAIGTTRTLTCAAVASLTDIDFRDITIAGAAAPVSGTRLGDCKGNSGITFPAGKTVYWRQTPSGGNWGSDAWSLTLGGAYTLTAFPLAQDTAVFSTYPNTGQTVTINAAYNIGTIDMSARTSNTMTLATGSNTPAIYGNWINGTGTTLTGTGTLTFAGRGSQTITSAGKTFTQLLSIETPGGSVTLQDALTCNRNTVNALQLESGTLDANDYNITLSGATSGFNSDTSNTRTFDLGSGTLTIAGAGSVFDVDPSTNLTVTGTGTISLTSASAKTFAGGGISYSGITLNQGGTGTLTVTDSNKFANITNTAIGRVQFTGGTTNEFTAFNLNGVSGNLLQVGSTNTTQAILKAPSWNVGANSTDAGNNTGLSFTAGTVDYLSVSYINGQIVAGAVHATTGALTGPGSSVLGLAARFRAFDASGALVGPGSIVTGDSTRFRAFGTSGALVGPGSTVTGDTNRFRAFNTTGDLTGAGSLLSGDARRYRVFDATGEIPGVTAQIVGTASISITHDTAGALVGSGSALTGASVLIKLYPDPSDVREGVQYGPGGMYVGTLTVVDGQTIIRIRSITERL